MLLLLIFFLSFFPVTKGTFWEWQTQMCGAPAPVYPAGPGARVP